MVLHTYIRSQLLVKNVDKTYFDVLISTRSEIHPHAKVKRIYLWLLPLIIQYTVAQDSKCFLTTWEKV